MSQATLQNLLNVCFDIHAKRSALEVDGNAFTYADLDRWVTTGAIAVLQAESDSAYITIFGYRSTAAFLGILSTIKAAKAYLPVSHKFPPQRLFEIFQISQSDTLFLGQELADHFRAFLEQFDDQLPELNIFFLPQEREAIIPLEKDFPRHYYWEINPEAKDTPPEFPETKPTDPAYLLFTSGSTGKPKGIMITYQNISAYLTYILNYFDFQSDDRFSQCFDLTFDYSVHDMFCCWLSGACLCVIPATSLIAPAKFLEKSGITIWFSVPSLAITMDKLRMLRPDRFPKIRLSLFGGEAVSKTIVQSWQVAAPNSTIFNVYGPTEATINVTHYQWDPVRSPEECVNDGVPLGDAFGNMEIKIIDESENDVESGEKGQLIVTGPQIANGYYKNSEKTEPAFRTIRDDDRKWYFTGDLTSRDENGLIRYFGRIDFQVQICGHRVELAEIEFLLRSTTNTENVVAIPWPFDPQTGRADYIVAVIEGSDQNQTAPVNIGSFCRARLPDYAVPSRVVYLDQFPLNINGKIDRGAIASQLKERLP